MNDEMIKRQNIFNLKRIKYIMDTFQRKPQDKSINNLVWNILVFQMWWVENSKYLVSK